jgi:Icc-related predicted phosphoesterase
MTEIVATSDLHGTLPEIPLCDLLILAGDICPDGSLVFQATWLDQTLRKWLKNIPAKVIVAIAGNHDLIFEKAPELVPKNLPWHYLKDQRIEIAGLKIYGSPWQLPFWGAFNKDDIELEQQYRNVPHDIDIFINHGPPYGIGDAVMRRDKQISHTGSIALRDKIFEIKPKLAIFGHIHDAFGRWDVDQIQFANVSLLDDRMKPVHPLVHFKI